MTDSPYRAPNLNKLESAPIEHRSFRLTPGSESPDTIITSGSLRDAIIFPVVQQLSLLLLSAMLLDGGLVFRRVSIASVAFWMLALIIMIRRGQDVTGSDVLLVKWGYIPILLATSIVWILASTFAAT